MPYESFFAIKKPFHPVQPNRNFFIASKTDSPTQTRIKIRIPRNYHREPVISRLTSHHGLAVNISRALLSADSLEAGSFDLELYGKIEQIQSALAHLQALKIEIKGKPNPDGDGW